MRLTSGFPLTTRARTACHRSSSDAGHDAQFEMTFPDPCGSYDEFLGILRDSGRRKRLEELPEANGDTDEVYRHVRANSHRLRECAMIEAQMSDSSKATSKLSQRIGEQWLNIERARDL